MVLILNDIYWVRKNKVNYIERRPTPELTRAENQRQFTSKVE
jgi:hypothetical protein